MKSYCLALFFGLLALVAAQSSTSPFYITSPLPGTVLKAGDSIDLEWKNGLDQTVKVLVIQGANSGTMSPTDISFDVEGEDGTHTFKVPRSLSPAGTYAFQFEYKDDSGSPGPVTVTGGTGTVDSVSATASVAHASSSVASSLPTPSASSIPVASSSAISAPASSPSGVSASGKTSAAASTTPIPSSASNNLITGFALTMPVLLALAGYYA
ncbi:hypothetical protein [Absidia glauca]|uniref:Yeast cell wall synthesis Kre9/Knh1-like N-terminal domain-containing protein n=1 Tax=Absidia glauca TaxID=4829 RepID=A0A168RBZ7_ABSGL|nr:hypothetical protein [Absidia glauca]